MGPNILVFILPLFLGILLLSHRILTGHNFARTPAYTKILKSIFCVMLCLIGFLWYSVTETMGYRDAVAFRDSSPSSLSGVIVSEVSRYDSTNYFYLKEDGGRKIRVTVRTDKPLFVGQHLTIEEPTLTPVNIANKEIQSTRKFLGNGATLTATFPYSPTFTVNGIQNPVLYYAKWARNETAKLFGTLFSSEVSGFLTSLLSSDQSGLSDELYQDFIATGSIHILVVSGMHFNYLAGALLFLLGFFVQSRRKKLLITLPLLLLFSVYTGGTLPVLRAFFMTTLLFLGDLFYKKRSHSYVTIPALASLFLLVSPTLVWNPSFLLTFGATLGITWFYRPLLQKFQWIRPEFLRSYLALQLSVQVFTLPIVCFFFSRISKVSILTNFLVAPLVPVILILAMLIPVTAKIPVISTAMIAVTEWICNSFLWCVKTTAKLMAPLRFLISEIPFLALLCIGGGLFFWTNAQTNKRKIACFLLIASCFTIGTRHWILPPEKDHLTLTFFGASNTQSVCIATPNDHLILYGTIKDIVNARYSAAFPAGTPISLLILTDLSDPGLINELLTTNPIGQVALPEAYRDNWDSPCPVRFCSSDLTTVIDGTKLTLVTDAKTFLEVEFSYKGTVFSMTQNAKYLLQNRNPKKYWIYNFRRTGKDAREVALLPNGERLFSKKPWHPDGKLYDNTSIIYVDQAGLTLQGLTE
ncbi:MAG: ComEC/Rec2 family competence protein [Clostridia bacterium]|nr:ComEC/Rec2 family competence protein [Clostridia bacterium]